MSKEYDEYLTKHINGVGECLQWMLDNLVLTTPEHVAAWEASLRGHDTSKTTKEEYEAYDAYFYGGNISSFIKTNFDYAWLHHIHNNPHHWQYWILVNDDSSDGTYALEMPLTYVFEMVADWWSFSWNNGNPKEIFAWYEEHSKRIMFHKNTKKLVDSILNRIKEKLEELEKENG